ncbi:N-acetylglucosamine 6-phosphate deacetylase [Thalassoporum mexicanum PCC 7367]|uniref:N-acetylglucosamine-6-phosphate deacetylase n=1 Tax=Thalassoporum mexicanum TaxID=3457544 RepID=UPI00029F8968|nr:N-acetylglucosamine-6-phosphate deacetylase [Pseudanabaena sp. PCC 7367]AFY69608.1 N-acetylglucosamine 6-phosphate deacetylase [Pseudanabaena sp. PCC 7367]
MSAIDSIVDSIQTAQFNQEDLVCYSSGGIDLQINGALGVSFNQLDSSNAQRLPEICRFLWQQGIDGFLPTLVTTSIDQLHQSLAIIRTAMAHGRSPNSAQILGVHLEGPFLNPKKRGAHPPEHLLPLTLEQLQVVLADYIDLVKLITIAPELDSQAVAIPWLVDRGIVVSLGHSIASASQTQAAFQLGAKMITHAGNAMPVMHHREPGLLGSALLEQDIFCGLIADGVHVHPQMADLFIRLKSSHTNRIVLVSDALAPLGLPDGDYPWDNRQISLNEGIARLGDGTLAGTALPLFAGVKNLVSWLVCAPTKAIAMATETPRQLIGLPMPKSHSCVWYWQSRQQRYLNWQRLSVPHPLDADLNPEDLDLRSE